MRLAVLADIHGNLPALEAVLEATARQSIDGFIVAGDFTDRGPFPLETVRRVQSLDSWTIRGNADEYFLPGCNRLPENWRTSMQWGAMRWMDRQLDDEARAFIASLPEQLTVAVDGADPIRVVHCSPGNSRRPLFPDRDPVVLELFRKARLLPPEHERLNLDTVLMGIQEPVLICGHMHIPWKQTCGDRTALNPGSVSLSVNGDPRAHYALLTLHKRHWQVVHRVVDYDREKVMKAFRDRGFLDEGGAMARTFSLMFQTGQNIPFFFFDHVHAIAREDGLSNGNITDEVWQRAEATFDWTRWSENSEPN